jgi:agmatinase
MLPTTILGCDSGYDSARLVVFGASFDCTTSFRPGARFGPRAIRGDSIGLETYSPYQDADLADIPVHDAGDLDLSLGSAQLALEQVEAYAGKLLDDGKCPVMLGGEHLVSLGVIRVLAKRVPDLHIVHFDAHTDLRDEYLDVSLSHAAVMRRAWELLGDGRIHQFGIRSGDRAEFEWAAGHVEMCRFNFEELADTVAALAGKPVYFSLDLDVLDPSVFPGTGTPEPGGVSFMELLTAVQQVGKLKLVGCDLVELAPGYDVSGASTAVACKVLRELLIAMGG